MTKARQNRTSNRFGWQTLADCHGSVNPKRIERGVFGRIERQPAVKTFTWRFGKPLTAQPYLSTVGAIEIGLDVLSP
ncbi:hypothetical protein [Paragemmobacter aquarius]|uniref:hypothetical protein n=1 Tax=Paragemmobacter aquarius TaxID=2169400 RepID=UPI001C1FC542|nr:hypothetical protein [Gemmobacter aquarius]